MYQLGNYNDPVYGKTSARIISQFRLPSNNPTFGLLRQELEDLEDQGGVQDTLNEQERVNAAYLYIPYQQVRRLIEILTVMAFQTFTMKTLTRTRAIAMVMV